MYNQFNPALATDFNDLIGTVNGSTANKLNSFWGVGYGNVGYGQTQINNLAGGGVINASDWSSLYNALTKSAAHQNTSITALPTVGTGSRIDYISTVPTDITSCYNNRLNAASQGSTTTYTGQRTTSWSNAITITHTITFESGDKARYFFNAGGQISVNFSITGGSTLINSLFKSLATACGTMTLSSPTSTSTVSIAGSSFTGITRSGGSGTPSILNTGVGYYSLTTTDTEVFKQLATGLTPSGYVNSFISMSLRTNGTQGSYGDTGSIIYITTTFDEIPDNLVVDGTTNSFCVLKNPSTTNLAASWGTISVVSTSSGS